jgi:hypothetical protein
MRVKLTDFGISRSVDLSFEQYYSLQSGDLHKKFGIEQNINLISKKQIKQILLENHLQQHMSPTSAATRMPSLPSQGSSKWGGIVRGESSKSQLGTGKRSLQIPLGSLQSFSPVQRLHRQAEKIKLFVDLFENDPNVEDNEIVVIDIDTQIVDPDSNYVVLQQTDELNQLFTFSDLTNSQNNFLNSKTSQTNFIFSALSSTAQANCGGNGYRLLKNNPMHVDFSSSEAVLYHLRLNLQRISECVPMNQISSQNSSQNPNSTPNLSFATPNSSPQNFITPIQSQPQKPIPSSSNQLSTTNNKALMSSGQHGGSKLVDNLNTMTVFSSDSINSLPKSIESWCKYSSLNSNMNSQSSNDRHNAKNIGDKNGENKLAQNATKQTQNSLKKPTTVVPTSTPSHKPLESIVDSYYTHPMYSLMNFSLQSDKDFLFPLILEKKLLQDVNQNFGQDNLPNNTSLSVQNNNNRMSLTQHNVADQAISAMKLYQTYKTTRLQQDAKMKKLQYQKTDENNDNENNNDNPVGDNTSGDVETNFDKKTNPQNVVKRQNSINNIFKHVGSQHMTSNMGTAVWMAPEVWILSHDKDSLQKSTKTGQFDEPSYNIQYSYPADIYSLGIVLYELICLQPPPPTLPESLSDNSLPNFALTFPPDVPFYIQQLILACLSFDPNKRPSAVDIVNVLTIFIELIDSYHLFSKQ